jgi:hypothetical protein
MVKSDKNQGEIVLQIADKPPTKYWGFVNDLSLGMLDLLSAEPIELRPPCFSVTDRNSNDTCIRSKTKMPLF